MKTEAEMEKEAREATLNSINIYFNDFIDDRKRRLVCGLYQCHS